MLSAGFARVEVTPPLGTVLTGYFSPRISDGVRDPIELNAVAVTVNEESILIITGDFMYINEKDATRYRTLIAEELDFPVDHILTQALHQHTSTSAGKYGPSDEVYQKFLERKYVDVARMALDDRKEAAVYIGQKETAEPVSFIRRFRMKDGSCRTNPGYGNPDIVHPIGEADNTVRLVEFKREGAKDILIAGFQTHPDMIGGNKFSADWPGFVRRMTEKDLKNVHCLLVNGCQGDTNHVDVKNGIEFGKDFDKKYEKCRKTARIITDVVCELYGKGRKVEPEAVSGCVEMKYIPSNTSGMERIEECKAINAKIVAQIPLEVPLKMAEKGEVRRIANMENLTVFQKVPVTVLGLGEIVFVGYGGEPFTEYADKIREAFPELFIFSVCIANGGQGYLPSVEAFEEGGYEARTTNFTSSVAPVLQGAAKEMIEKHKELCK